MASRPMTSRIIIPVDLSYLAPVTAYITQLAQSIGFEPKKANRICLALEESLSNVVKFGYEEDTDDNIEIVLEHNSTGLVIRILEKGIPFSEERLPDYQPDIADMDENWAGLGLHLIKSFTDDFKLIRKGRDGQEIHLIHRLTDNTAGHAPLPEPEAFTPKMANQPARQDAPLDYVIRELKRNEAVEVSKCAYKCYGYTYEEFIYYPQQLAKMNQQGLLYSLVAVDSANKIMGHAALKFSHPGALIAESGVAFVLPEYRRLGLFGQFNQRFIEHAASIGLHGLYGRAVTSHTASQRMAAAHGYKDCGLLLGVFPGDVVFKKIADRAQQRESGVLSFLPLKPDGPRNIYLPGPYHGLVGRLFEALGMPVGLEDQPPSGHHPQDHSFLMETTSHHSLNLAEITVRRYGQGFEQDFRRMVKTLCLNRIDVIHVVFDLENPLTPTMVRGAEKLGFVFSGILPHGLDNRHALIMQYHNNIEIDPARIKLLTPEAGGIMEFMGKPL